MSAPLSGRAKSLLNLRRGPRKDPADLMHQRSVTVPDSLWKYIENCEEGGGNTSAAFRVILQRYRAMMEIAHLRKLMRGAVPDAGKGKGK
jgi:hypothetical protein